MAKSGKLGKLLKKVQSIGRTSSSIDHHNHRSLSRRSSSLSSSSSTIATSNSNIFSFDSSSPESYSPNNLYPVYVGKSRRRYVVSSEVLGHPLFQELVERSLGGRYGGAEEISVGCEVVLFEHLLWMLENADPQPESLDELVDFYAC